MIKDPDLYKAHYKLHMIMTHILHTAEMTNVNSVMFVNIIKKMVGFKLGKKQRKMFFVLSQEW